MKPKNSSIHMNNLSKPKVAVIGLGYVGLPLAISFAKQYKTTGFDISLKRINQLKESYDSTLEIKKSILKKSNIIFTGNIQDLATANFFIVTVPTPVDRYNVPDLNNLVSACNLISKVIQKNSVVIFESTVYPGCTEEECIPIIEKKSGLKLNKDFYVGYSPERINPGDKIHTFEKINKVVSGSNQNAAKKIFNLYSKVINAEIFIAKSIKVAEASKVIENTQRDINIALMNELSEIFEKMDIDTNDVLKASNTKWNFINFRPGLVGGHCIGVDPYYLAYKSKLLGVNSRMILSGRSVNNKVFNRIVNITKSHLKKISKPKISIMGITFKENCPDIRNSGALRVLKKLNNHGFVPTIFDPYYLEDPKLKDMKYSFTNSFEKIKNNQDAILILVPHKEFLSITPKQLIKKVKKSGFIFDAINLYNFEGFKKL
jgi:UDP-N-acetyl-D-galactosamine dehydrogenase